MNRYFLSLCFAVFGLNFCLAADLPLIRIGTVASGTLAWELAAMQDAGLLDNNEFKLQTVTLANPQAGKVALQAGSVDMIVSDWIWVAAMRADDLDYSFYPFSNNAGGLLVAAHSTINSLADLSGKKLGIAGGELDKNWLLLQALGQRQGLDLNNTVQKVYGAPPLLNQQLQEQRLDALLTYWQFGVRLETQGYRQLVGGEDILRQLGVSDAVPSVGYVFKANWAAQHKAALLSFLAAADKASDQLCSDDPAWRKISHLLDTSDAAEQQLLRSRYCQGRVKQWSNANKIAAGQIWQLLHQLGANKLTGKAAEIPVGTFWSAD